MRWRPLTWLLLSVLCFAAAFCFWRLGDKWAARRTAPPPARHATRNTLPAAHAAPQAAPGQLSSQAGTLNSPPAPPSDTQHATRNTNQFALRLSNTTTPLRQLLRSDRAILLENALLDTARPGPAIPDQLRAQGDPGSYLVQARGPTDNAFRALLQAAGAAIVSYIPNNAYLVRASAAVAQQLQAAPQTQAVLPYEPYYKLKPSLLKLAVAQQPLPDNSVLNVLLFADARAATLAALTDLGAQVLGEDRSPFGPVVRVQPPADSLASLAGLPGVQEMEWALTRAPANDFSRVRINVAATLLATNNYLGLSGSNVLVNINDSGVDATHPDLAPRVFGDSTNTLVDPNGHGTHVAGIIASSGGKSSTVTNASGPTGPYAGIGPQFRGMAPAANLFALPVGLLTGPFSVGAAQTWPSDIYLQETAALTNAFISNNSWNYVGGDADTYDLHAASYDAAVRDALPNVPGSQPLLLVFSAGDSGGGNTDGTAGNPGTILSPGTAKNVITVGAIEQLRNITNNVVNQGVTNQPWLAMTDSTNEVASFSSRGPVGAGTEGDTGRFKPDLVAPGTFVISTRSSQWDTNAYYNPTSHIYAVYPDVVIPTNIMYYDSIFVPANAVQLNIYVVPNTNSPVPFPDLLMYVKQGNYPTGTDPILGTNSVSLPPAAALDPVDAFWYFGISNRTAGPVVCDLVTDIVVTNELGNYLQVLAGMNDSLGGFYRYESGTSMAAADVSGTLALMQEFFQNLGLTNSPALMKALLINGARSVGNLYDFNVTSAVNSQGWGLINLPTTLPGSLTNGSAATNAMILVDQNPTNALATGQSRTYKLALSSAACSQPLRFTLVWTDPPGNPIASVKLVNNLDLIVTNLDDTNLVYFGNDIASGNDFNEAWNTNTAPNLDTINNVENVFLSPLLGLGSQLSTNYSVTVVGRSVNVNAVTAQTNNVCQDYALVISSGDGLISNAIAFDASAPIIYSNQPLVTVITNSFVNSPGYDGGILYNQRVGAQPELLGTNTIVLTNDADAVVTLGVTNQWHFYLITNVNAYTNAAFLTMLPVNLAVPRMGVFEPTADAATRPQADIDLYVAPPTIPNNFALTNLDPAVVLAADKSLTRGGTETIVYSNAVPGVYYVGVKSEDQQAAQYAFLGVFSQLPFGTADSNGVHLVGIPLNQAIPDGSPQFPGIADIVAVNIYSMKVRRVIVTNVLNHELMSDLIGGLSSGANSVVLNNHTCVIDPFTSACQTWTSYIYDDSSEHNVGPGPFLTNPDVQHTDGPGNLGNFAGINGKGQWLLNMVDNATNHVGTNISLQIFLERQPDLTNGVTFTLQGNSCRDDFVDVPENATSLTIAVSIVSATGPVDLSVSLCPLYGDTCKTIQVTNGLGGSVTISETDLPPLQPGTTYRVETCNLDGTPITVHLLATFGFSFNTFIPILTEQTTVPVPILNDAVTDIYLTNNLHEIISSLDVGLLINDPRVSDLAITLISPNGTRVLLFENRGAYTTNGLGLGTFDLSVVTNMAPFYTNNFDAAPVGLYAPGAVFEGWSVLSNLVDVMDDYTCLCLSNHVLGLLDGAVSNSLPTTNAVSAPAALNPYILTYRVNHLPWLEGMVTWWPLDVDGSDIFSGLDGLLQGDVFFSTGQTNGFFDDFNGPALNPMWQPALPNAGTGGGAVPVETYAGAPRYSFAKLGTNTVLMLNNSLPPNQRRGWSSATNFTVPDFCYETRFYTWAAESEFDGSSPGGFLEMWILDAANTNRYDMVSVYGGTNGASEALLAGSSIDGAYNTLPFAFQTNTWYRLVLSAAPNQGVQATVLDDYQHELAQVSFLHGASAFGSGFKIVLSQFGVALNAGNTNEPTQVYAMVDYARLTGGQSGEVNQAFYGDGVATRMIVPRCPALDLGLGRGFSIEGWINPFNITNPAPLVEWYDATPPTNQPSLGVQFWLSGLSGANGFVTNAPGALCANIWDTNLQSHIIATITNAITNAGWQHVALTYDTNSANAILYTNGHPAATMHFPTNFVPRTASDLYLGFDPTLLPTPISYPDFSSIAGLNLVGTAAQDGAVLRLTPAATGPLGNAWVPTKQSCAAGFTTTYRCRWSNLGGIGGSGGIGGDEIWFTVQNDSPTSPAGYGSFCNGTNFVSVFLNTRGSPASGDVSGNSIAIVTNNAYVTQTDLTPLGIHLKDGAVHTVQATFNGSAINVWLDTVQVLTNVLLPRLTIGTDTNGYGWVGLGAACGANYADQDVLSWTFGGPTPGTAFAGGLDEFSLYERALSPCEVNAIYNAGSRGKYGTNVLICPVATEVGLLTSGGYQTYVFTNGITWTNNGPHWETNTVSFSTSFTNPTPIVVCGLNPYNPLDTNAPDNLNAIVDDFILSATVTNTIDGLLHFTDDTNLAVLPIKFAPTPYTASNSPPVLIFSNSFISATQRLYTVGNTIAGSTNSPGIGVRAWTVTQGTVTVVSNAFFDAAATNWLAMATGAVQCLLPTSPGGRYQLSYNVRGPCAVGWWNGSVDPLSQRAQDLISGNNGAFYNGATNVAPGFVGNQGFFFIGQVEPPPAQDPDIWPEDIDDPSSQIELADPPQLQFTNAFTLECWINPQFPFNPTVCGTELIFFRGYPEPLDCRGLDDAYWLALEPSVVTNCYDLRFHIADAQAGTLGADVLTTNGPVQIGGGSNGGWWHVAAVFDKPFTNFTVVTNGTNFITFTTNALRLYLNGACIATNYTTLSPCQTLDPARSPGATIGSRCAYDWTEPFYGFMDEITAYARALTDPEIAAIATNGPAGKADLSVVPTLSLAKLSVFVDGSQLATVYGDNSQWTTYSVEFTALETNAVVTLQSLLPGTLVDGITLTEVASELFYQPEVPLSDLYGEDAYGVWTLEIMDDRVDPAVTTNNAQLLEWQLNISLAPSNPPPVITLSHGLPYTNSLPANSIQYFIVPVPQWATLATNVLLFADQVNTTSPLPVTVLFNQTNYPSPTNLTLIGPLVSSGTTVLATNSTPPLVIGQPYYLAVTNPNPVGVTFALGVWFDITTLTNCRVNTNFVGPAGIPRYFQFDVPTNGEPAGLPPQAVSFWLSGAQSNLTLVLSEHLPLPDLDHYDYLSQGPRTNDDIIMLVTNSTPFPIQTNRWYVGVFNTTATNVPFALQACLSTAYPLIIPLTNGIPFVVTSTASAFAAPPGPPQQFFFDFTVTNAVPGVLFELYNLSGNADLVLQQDVPPTMAPYFAGSFFPGTTPEQIVLRTSPELPDLRGQWFLGVYNNELSNVAYTIRATLPNSTGLLVSAQPFRLALTPLNPPHGLLLSWNSVVGERYFVQYTASIAAPVTWTNIGYVIATTPLTTFEVLPVPSGNSFFRIVQVYSSRPTLFIQLWSTNQVRLSWSTAYPGYTLQSESGLLSKSWTLPGLPVNVVGNDYVAYDTVVPEPKYYRLFR
jgi:subtilisin-like proprotein convertase family protein